MTLSKSIGGYFALESFPLGHDFHPNGLRLNSARNALRLLIRDYSINKIYAPFYTCPVVWDAIRQEGCELIPYDVGFDFRPQINLPAINEFFLYTNYFGVCDIQVSELFSVLGERLIIDNSQAFYSKPLSPLTFYSPRKFFGLPDGGLAYGVKTKPTEVDSSIENSEHLLKQIEVGKEGAYDLYKRNDEVLKHKDIKLMSPLTEFLYERSTTFCALSKRKKNFSFLESKLNNLNGIKIKTFSKPALCYPFYSKVEGLRDYLIKNKIYVPLYWPTVSDNGCMSSETAQDLAKHIVALPIDQRYSITEMEIIYEFVLNFV